MSTVPTVHAVDFTAPRRDQIVTCLEDLLTRAKAGEFVSFAAVADDGRELFLYYSGCDNLPELLGKLFFLQMRTWERIDKG